MKKITYIIFIIAGFISVENKAQNCLEYGEFDGPECVCAPSGWTAVTGAEEIDDMTVLAGTCNIPGPSPEGGSAVALNVNAGISESIETTIYGLEAGQYYSLSFWWITLSCPGFCCSDLEVNVDGETFEFEDAEEWTLVELCVLAESESIDIALSAIFDGGYTIYIDDTGCMPIDIPCCSLVFTIEEAYVTCPNQSISLDGSYENEVGDVVIEWTSDPEDGIDYLSDVTVVNPTFEYTLDDNEFDGITYTFTCTVMDDECSVTKEIEVEVLPLVTPTFVFEDDAICEDEEVFIFPTVSIEGISGTWMISEVELDEIAGQVYSNFFIPDAGEVDCPQQTEHILVVEELRVPTFEFPLYFCRSQFEEFEFPSTSIENIDGEWFPESLVSEDLIDGTVVATFTPDDLFCNNVVEVEIEIETGDDLNFELQSVYCDNISEFIFPSEDENGIAGFWDFPEMDFTELEGNYTNTFHPIDGDCYSEFLFEFEIVSQVRVSFDTIGVICRSAGEIVLDSISLEGIHGIWSLSRFDPDTIFGNSVVSTWSPLSNQSECIEDVTITFDIINSEALEFDIPSEICVIESQFTFPSQDISGLIAGTWSIPSFEPSAVGLGEISSMFIPDSNCVDSFLAVINIIPTELPIFSLASNYCENEDAFELPTVSENGIVGYWTVPIFIPQNYVGQQITNVFTPIEIDSCFGEYVYFTEVEEAIIPQFSLPDYLCYGDSEYELPTISDNNIEGFWNIPVVSNEMLQDSSSINLTFTPNTFICNAEYNSELKVSESIVLDIIHTAPSGCLMADGAIELSSNNNVEYSIDGGNTWSIDGKFNNLDPGNYEFVVRDLDFIECEELFYETLQSLNAPVISEIIIIDIIPCLNQMGIIEIFASGTDLEYSIDEGLTWTDENIFEILNMGAYTVSIREKHALDCIVEEEVFIDEFPNIIIEELVITNLSSCNSEDGILEVVAIGQNLEYSIDGGFTWNEEYIYENMISGLYDVVVRSKDQPDCYVMIEAEISQPDLPLLTLVEIFESKTCDSEGGKVIINSDDDNLEYSIDGGVTWVVNDTFKNLELGLHAIIIRFQDLPDCFDEISVFITEYDNILDEPNVEVLPVSDCNIDDASLVISTNENNVEFSLDAVNWQADNIFTNLAPGDYQVFMRNVLFLECIVEVDVEILEDCCNDLNVSYVLTPATCFENNGSIEIIDIEGNENNAFAFFWNHGSPEFEIQNLSSGWYSYLIQYDDMCLWEDSILVVEVDVHSFTIETFDEDCFGNNNGVINVIDIEGGVPPFDYSIGGEVYQSEGIFYNLSPGEYEVFVSDANDCLMSEQAVIEVGNYVDVSLESIATIALGESIYLNPLIDETTIDSFVWLPTAGLNNPFELITEAQPEVTTDYSLVIYYGEGCVTQRSIRVEVIDDDNVYLPNIFSPHIGDENSIFKPFVKQNSNIQFTTFKVYDRWGNLMVDKDASDLDIDDIGWDGTYNGDLLNPGVFVYYLKYSLGSTEFIRSGNVTLVR